MLIQDQFGIFQNLQMSPIPQTSFFVGTFFYVSYSKPTLKTYLWITLNIYFCFAVNKLKQEADVMINIPDDRASSNCIRIEGNKEGVAMAKEVR